MRTPRAGAIPRPPTGVPVGEAAAMSDARTDGSLRLTCRPSKAGNVLLFPYTLENQGSGGVYAVHALPGATAANETGAIVIAGEGGDVILGKFAPPLPADRRILIP